MMTILVIFLIAVTKYLRKMQIEGLQLTGIWSTMARNTWSFKDTGYILLLRSERMGRMWPTL